VARERLSPGSSCPLPPRNEISPAGRYMRLSWLLCPLKIRRSQIKPQCNPRNSEELQVPVCGDLGPLSSVLLIHHLISSTPFVNNILPESHA
jgi:hypothetical protein